MKKSKVGLFAVIATAALMASVGFAPANVIASLPKKQYFQENGKFYTDYPTFADAKKAANKLNLQLSEEGNTLLKNEGNALPMRAGAKLSVFGVTQDNLIGGGADSITDSLTNAGFDVNPALVDFYADDQSALGQENLDFTGSIDNSLGLYNDGAVMVISRNGGEGADLSTVMTETVKTGDKHAHLLTDTTGTHKHYLMLTDSEEALLTYIEAHFDKVHIVINSSHILEVGGLKDDAKVKSILWIGRPGETGIGALGEIYAGKVNPSGSTVDEWERDFTADPTWQNFGNNSQNGSTNLYNYYDGRPAGANSLATSFPPVMPGYHGVDYEEGIYLGYRYYESVYADMAKTDVTAANKWYDSVMAYPFGYGLNFTSFSFKAGGLFKDSGCTQALGTSVAADVFASSVGHEAPVKKLYLPVTVTNTGLVAGKKTVQIYVTAPYTAGGVEKPGVMFAGFAKTDIIEPGKSATVTVEFNVQDFASYDAEDKNGDGNKGYELDKGDYVVRVMDSSHYDYATDASKTDDAYDEVKFTLGGTADLKLDDFSGNELANVFSKENGRFYSVREGKNQVATANEVIMSRSDFKTTFPKFPTKDDLTFSKATTDNIVNWEKFDVDNTTDYAKYDTAAQKADAPWAEDVNVPDTWTQNAGNGTIALIDMSGIDPEGTEVLTAGKFKGKTGKQAWETFMNTLTWDELMKLPSNGGWSTTNIDSIGLKSSTDNDSPEDWHSTHLWCDTPTISATYNVDLAKQEGIIIANLGMLELGANLTGWYGPGMNTHRTPFSGRNNQFYSQDGLQAGYMAAAVVQGATSRGVVCYPKHFALNDQETSRDGELSFSWCCEQALREIYLKPFQMCMQEGGSKGIMTAFARFGDVPAPDNYNLLTVLSRGQWGWKGYFVTDAYLGASRAAPLDEMARAGNDLALGSGGDTQNKANIMTDFVNGEQVTTPVDRKLSGTWDATKRSGKGDVVVGDSNTESLSQYYFVRSETTRILYNMSNSIKATNGVKLEQYAGKELTAQTQGVALSGVSVAADAALLNGASTKYSIIKGALPSGVAVSNDGSLTGTPTLPGDYAFTVQCVADNWQVGSASFTLHVNSAFTWSGDDAATAKVGTAFSAAIDSDTVNTTKYDKVVYTVASGALPDGLTLSENGEITGTPTKAGTFAFTIDAAASKSVNVGPFARTTVTHYVYNQTIVVTEDAKQGEDYGKEISDLNSALSGAKADAASAQAEAAAAKTAADNANSAAAAANAAAAAADANATAANDAAAKANEAAKAGRTVGAIGIAVGCVGLVAGALAIILGVLKRRK